MINRFSNFLFVAKETAWAIERSHKYDYEVGRGLNLMTEEPVSKVPEYGT
jgi:hypothetical protein